MKRSNIWERLEESATELKRCVDREALPDTAVVLGSGFKGFEHGLSESRGVDLAEIPHMPVPSVEGHGGAVVVGQVDGREVVVLTGRIHMYEGHSPQDVVYPLRVLSTLGVQNVMLTNASGSLDPQIRPGQMVLVRDQINFSGRNCLTGVEAKEFGSAFVDMSNAYDGAWRERLKERCELIEGVYAGMLGPTYETPAEVGALRALGAHVVGMSTVQETIASRQLKLQVACLSFVTNMAGGVGETLDHESVLRLVSDHQAQLHETLRQAIAVAP